MNKPSITAEPVTDSASASPAAKKRLCITVIVRTPAPLAPRPRWEEALRAILEGHLQLCDEEV